MDGIYQSLDRVLSNTLDRLLAHLPELLGALALLAIGWVLARALSMLARRGAAWLDAMLDRGPTQVRWRVGASARMLGAVVYWVVLLFFIAAATQALGWQTLGEWLARLLVHLPAVAAGLAIIVAGYVLSGFVAEIVRAATHALAAPQSAALARIAQVSTLALAVFVGADQVGLKVTWIAIFAAVILASLMGGTMLAVGMGARTYFANLIGAFYLGQAMRVGQRVRVAGHEGRIVDLTPTSLVLETADGRVLLPGRVYHDEAIVVLAREEGGPEHG